MTLTVLSFNIHKGFAFGNRKLTIHGIREAIRVVNADVVFLQEVLGDHNGHPTRHGDLWPTQSQFEFLADEAWPHFAYAKNAVYDAGHHGNAILSKFPIIDWENIDISTNRLERRGCLHCVLDTSAGADTALGRVHALCLHLNLLRFGRKRQYHAINHRLRSAIPDDEAVIVAGDFNDWDHTAPDIFESEMRMVEVFRVTTGRHARSFPAVFPLLCLDRIYVRGLRPHSASVHRAPAWRGISDHAALSAILEL